MPAEDVTIEGTFSINDYRYTINYYYDDEIAENEIISNKADFNEVIKADTPSTKENDGKNYMLAESGAYEVTIGTNEDANIINVYYVLDNNGPEGTPDEIPDSEEFAITYYANAANAQGETADTNIYPVGYQVSLQANNFVNTGNDFTGWGSDTAGTTVYSPEHKVEMVEGGVNVYVQWTSVPETPVNPPTPINPATPDGPTTRTTTPEAPEAPAAVTPATVLQTITEPLTALADTIGEALNANVEEIVPIDEDGVPLANRVSTDHKCCLLHVLLLLLAMFMEIAYMRSVKKRQQRIFELREEIALADKELKQNKDKEGIA